MREHELKLVIMGRAREFLFSSPLLLAAVARCSLAVLLLF